jgi:hypothetical protein
MPECPVFRPTLEEFANFSKFIERIEPRCRDIGCCKIIPPHDAGWWKKPADAEKFADTLDINIGAIFSTHPFYFENLFLADVPGLQMVSGHAGVFSVDILEGKPHTLQEFKKVANKRDPGRFGEEISAVERRFWKTVGLPKVGD